MPVGLFFSIIFAGSVAAFAQRSPSQDVIEKIQQAQQNLKASLAPTRDCQFPGKVNCDSNAYCAELEKNADSLNLYKNSEGKVVPNFPLLKFASDFEGCFDVDKVRYSEDPLLYFDLMQSVKANGGDVKKMIENRRAWERASDNLRPLFEDTKEQILAIIDAKKNGTNQAIIEKYQERIKGIKFATIEAVDSKQLAKNACDLPNAVFKPEDQTLYLCPQLLEMPGPAVQMVIAHEMGHSIDPCTISKDLYTDGTNNLALSDLTGDKSLIAKTKSKIRDGVDFNSNLFSSVITCLQKPESLNVPLPETIVAFEKYRACEAVSGSKLMTEGFSDWVSSQVLKRKVSQIKDPAKAKQFAFESQLLFLSVGCQSLTNRVGNKLLGKENKPAIAGRCVKLQGLYQDDQHSETNQRIGRMMLAPKEMQQALGCKGTSAVECR